MGLVAELDNEQTEQILDVNRTSFAQIWQPLDVTQISPANRGIAHRLNALGDNFYFIKIILRKHRLSDTFHRYYCNQFLCWSLLDVFEVPRDHFKTTIGLGMAMWWALPFNNRDEAFMRNLGYDDSWIEWMRRAHDQNTRTLVAMEVIKNAWKVGKKISGEYHNNDFFKKLFPEIIPDSSCQWSADTMTHKRDFSRSSGNQGEGTYEFTGIDAALQSKHYDRMICDDLFGKDALKSELVATSTWEWFKLLAGAFDSDAKDPDALPDLVVNGNRWSFHDLNWMIRKEMPSFRFHTHDAEGGCCDEHPAGFPLFPEEFSMKKLARLRHWFGEYFYSCQFRNQPIPPGGNQFKSEWLRYFVFKTVNVENQLSSNEANNRKYLEAFNRGLLERSTFEAQPYDVFVPDQYEQKRHKAIRHEIHNGSQPKDVLSSNLSKMLLVDPNHSGEKGRANNCVMVLGINFDPLRIYILDGMADTCSRIDTIGHIYRMAEAWRIRTVWVETSAGQAWLQTLLQMEDVNRKKDGKWYFHEVKNFKDNRNENAKSDRIEDTEPYFHRGQIWINTHENSKFTQKFLEEYNEYPHCATRDILDTLGHGLQNLQHSAMSEKEMNKFITGQQNRMQQMHTSRSSITGY